MYLDIKPFQNNIKAISKKKKSIQIYLKAIFHQKWRQIEEEKSIN